MARTQGKGWPTGWVGEAEVEGQNAETSLEWRKMAGSGSGLEKEETLEEKVGGG